MLFRVNPPAHEWDNWLFHEDKYYLFFLMGLKEGPWNAFGLATSEDAVHWQYYGPIVTQKHPDAIWMGTGYTWRSPVPGEHKYILNFSEWFNSPDHPGQQKIYFCESDDLIHWRHLSDELEFTPDPKFYRVNEGNFSRWDTIHELKKPNGGLYGYLTATPKDFLHGTGFVESDDGIHWRCLPPPQLIFSKPEHAALMNPKNSLEIGGIARFGHRYALIISDGPFGMALMWADKPEGPFVSQAKNFNFFPCPKGPDKHNPVYYARFFFAKTGETFFNIHAIGKGRAHGREPHPVYTTPLKLAKEDAEGILRAYWWPGNNVLKATALSSAFEPIQKFGEWYLAPITPKFDVRKGLLIETTFKKPLSDQKIGWGVQLTNPYDAAALYELFLLDETGGLEIGVCDLGDDENSYDFEDRVDLESPLLVVNSMRLLLRLGFMELYVNEQLLRHWSLAMWPSGQVAWIAQITDYLPEIRVWSMDLSDISRDEY
jgi:hypothetical protein